MEHLSAEKLPKWARNWQVKRLAFMGQMVIGPFSETKVMKGSVNSEVAPNLTGIRKDIG